MLVMSTCGSCCRVRVHPLPLYVRTAQPVAPGSASTSTHRLSPVNHPPGGVGIELDDDMRTENSSYTLAFPDILPPAPIIVAVSDIVIVTLVADGIETTWYNPS